MATPAPMKHAAEPLTGNEVVFVVQAGRVRRLSLDTLMHEMGTPQTLIERVDTTVGQSVSLKQPFTETPTAIPIATWDGNTRIESTVASLSRTSVTLGGKQLRSTLLTSSGSYQDAKAGQSVAVILIGR